MTEAARLARAFDAGVAAVGLELVGEDRRAEQLVGLDLALGDLEVLVDDLLVALGESDALGGAVGAAQEEIRVVDGPVQDLVASGGGELDELGVGAQLG